MDLSTPFPLPYLLLRRADGSRRVEILDKTSGKRIQLREIHARVRRRSGRWISVRLWTNLLDHTRYPAKELVALYGLRWEQEIAYKELKIHLRRSPLLLSHTLITAGQEVAVNSSTNGPFQFKIPRNRS